MAGFQEVPLTAEAQAYFRYTANPTKIFNCGLYFSKADGWDFAAVGLLADRVHDLWTVDMVAYMPTTAECYQVLTRDLSTEFGAYGAHVETTVGTNAGAMASSQCAIVTKFLIGGGGPPRHGFVFYPFVPEADVSSQGVLSGGSLSFDTDLSAAITAVESAVDAGQVCVSRYSKTENPIKPYLRAVAATAPVTAYSTLTTVGSQRDRRAGA